MCESSKSHTAITRPNFDASLASLRPMPPQPINAIVGPSAPEGTASAARLSSINHFGNVVAAATAAEVFRKRRLERCKFMSSQTRLFRHFFNESGSAFAEGFQFDFGHEEQAAENDETRRKKRQSVD